MKILMLTSRFGSGYGMGYSAYKEAQQFADQHHEVTVVHCNTDAHLYNDGRFRLIHLPISKIRLLDFLLFKFSLKKLFKRKLSIGDFDVLYIQSLEFGLINFSKISMPVFYFARSTMRGLRNALHSENVPFSILKKINHFFLVNLEQRCLRASNTVFAKSSIMAMELEKLYKVPAKKISVITGGIDDLDFKRATQFATAPNTPIALPGDIPVVLYAGRIVPQKGLLYLVQAAISLLAHEKLLVVIAGQETDSRYCAIVRQAIELSGHNQAFRFLGHVNQMEMASLFNQADCLVTPSVYEPFGMVNLQAAFLGKPVITTNATGSIDLLKDYSGLSIVKPQSVNALADALKKQLFGTKPIIANFDFRPYSWKRVSEQIISYFQASLDETSSGL